MTEHPLDEALSLETIGDGRFRGRTTPAYWNMAGPFGGITGALMLRAVLEHPEAQGRPVALTVNFCGAVAEGEFEITARLVRGGKSTQHWQVEMAQEGRGVATTASVVMGVERETWSHAQAQPPKVPPADAVPLYPTAGRMSWFGQYEMRFATGQPTLGTEPLAEPRSGLTQLWVRDTPPRPLDYPALAAISDSFIVRLLLVRGDFPPVATVSLSTYFLADSAGLARQGDRPLLGTADVRAFRHGFHDQSAELWSDDGELLAVSHQVVWFKS
jgi:acyl-CoA thioesterase